MEFFAILLAPWQASLEHSWFTWFLLLGAVLFLFVTGRAILSALRERDGESLVQYVGWLPQGIFLLLASLTVGQPSYIYWFGLFLAWPGLRWFGTRLLLGWRYYRRPLMLIGRSPGVVVGPPEGSVEAQTIAVGPDARLTLHMAEANEYLVSFDQRVQIDESLLRYEQRPRGTALRQERLCSRTWYFHESRPGALAAVRLQVTRYTLEDRLPAASPEAFGRMLDLIAMENFFYADLECGSPPPQVSELALWFNEGTPVVDCELPELVFWPHRVSFIPVGADTVLGLAFTCQGITGDMDMDILTRFAREQARLWTLEDPNAVTDAAQWQGFQPRLTDHLPAEQAKLDMDDLKRLFRRHCTQELEWVAFEQSSAFYFQWMETQYQRYEDAVTARQQDYVDDFLARNLAAIPADAREAL